MIPRLHRRVAASRAGHLLAAAHLFLVVYEFAHKPAVAPSSVPCAPEPSSAVLIAGRLYHYHYESGLLRLITDLDVPALALAALLSTLLAPLRLCEYAASWAQTVIFLVCAYLQWLLVGYSLAAFARGFKRWVTT